MKIFNGKDMIGGWFIGNFNPSVFRTELFEVCYKVHKKNEKIIPHYHKNIEINYLLHGEMIINGVKLKPNDIFIIEPMEIANVTVLKKSELIVIKSPSDPNDKFEKGK